MRTDRTRFGAVRASSRLALVIAREIELFADAAGASWGWTWRTSRRWPNISPELVESAPPKVGLVDAQALAEQLGVARDWVYANAERLGVVRLGSGPRARMRFDVEQAREALTADAEGDQSRRDGPPRAPAWTFSTVRVCLRAVPLIQGRSDR